MRGPDGSPSLIAPQASYLRQSGAKCELGMMSPNEKSAHLFAIVAALEELRREATRLEERTVSYVLAMAADEARKAAENTITRA